MHNSPRALAQGIVVGEDGSPEGGDTTKRVGVVSPPSGLRETLISVSLAERPRATMRSRFATMGQRILKEHACGRRLNEFSTTTA